MLTPKKLAKRLLAFEQEAVSDQDYQAWCDEVSMGLRSSWLVIDGVRKEDIDRYKTFLFSDVRFDFVYMLKPRSKKPRLSNEDYGYLGKNPMVPLLIEANDETLNRHIEHNSTNLFVHLIEEAVRTGNKSVSLDIFCQWRPSWEWNIDMSDNFQSDHSMEFLENWGDVRSLIHLGPYSEDDKLDVREVNNLAFGLFYDLWNNIEQFDRMNLVQGSLAIFDLCHRLGEVMGLPRQHHLLSFLEEP